MIKLYRVIIETPDEGLLLISLLGSLGYVELSSFNNNTSFPSYIVVYSSKYYTAGIKKISFRDSISLDELLSIIEMNNGVIF